MMFGSSHWQSLMDTFHNAAFDSDLWYPALQRLAEATGSSHGQLIGLAAGGEAGEIERFNLVTDVDAEALEAHRAVGGMDPDLNPRSRAGMSAPLMQSLAEGDYLTADEHRRHPYFREFAHPMGMPFSCLVSVECREGLLVGMAVLRSAADGHIEDGQRKRFDAAACVVRAAVRTRMALEGQEAALIQGALEALRRPVFVCDGRGRVMALTGAAESLLSGPAGLQLRNGRFHLRNGDCRELNDAVSAAANGESDQPLLRSVVVRCGGSPPVVLDVISLPVRDYAMGFGPRVLVAAGAVDRDDEDRAGILRAAYGLTSAEAAIATGLWQGASMDGIAAQRSVTVGTVRAQTKRLLAKVGVRRQAELVAHLSRLGL